MAVLLPATQAHRQPVLHAHGEAELRLDRMTGHQVEAVALAGHRQDERGLHDREVIADAEARAAPEREERVAMTLAHALRREALRVEAFGVVPERGMPMRDVRAQDDRGPRWYPVAADLVVLDRRAGDLPGRRIEPWRRVDARC